MRKLDYLLRSERADASLSVQPIINAISGQPSAEPLTRPLAFIPCRLGQAAAEREATERPSREGRRCDLWPVEALRSRARRQRHRESLFCRVRPSLGDEGGQSFKCTSPPDYSEGSPTRRQSPFPARPPATPKQKEKMSERATEGGRRGATGATKEKKKVFRHGCETRGGAQFRSWDGRGTWPRLARCLEETATRSDRPAEKGRGGVSRSGPAKEEAKRLGVQLSISKGFGFRRAKDSTLAIMREGAVRLHSPLHIY
ncbi:hypothetical protein QQF64_027551 [Cirrhinus molitorella]|uniref:Uncharacterized protein n=1 Tax=Cirrhinus molitorella TaxID=172907 RepID=A0ABR3NDA9_9TELE